MTIRLLTHHVLVKMEKPVEADEVYRRAVAAGIHIQLDPRTEKACEYGTVVAVGPTAFRDFGGDPSLLSVGDRVSMARYAGKTVQDTDGTEYVLVNDQDILCVVE